MADAPMNMKDRVPEEEDVVEVAEEELVVEAVVVDGVDVLDDVEVDVIVELVTVVDEVVVTVVEVMVVELVEVEVSEVVEVEEVGGVVELDVGLEELDEPAVLEELDEEVPVLEEEPMVEELEVGVDWVRTDELLGLEVPEADPAFAKLMAKPARAAPMTITRTTATASSLANKRRKVVPSSYKSWSALEPPDVGASPVQAEDDLRRAS